MYILNKKLSSILFTFSIISLLTLLNPVESKEKKIKSPEKKISLTFFIQNVITNDPNFPLLLIDQLYSNFQKDLKLPASDIVLDISAQYDLFLPLNDNNTGIPWEGSLSLSKLFPGTGTTISTSYNNSLMAGQTRVYNKSAIGLSLSQSIAQNAFGVLTRMQSKKIEIENKITQYQIIEAYEEYLASLIQIYFDWYTTSENLKAAETTLLYNKDLLRSIQKKRRYNIAFNEDIYKVKLEVLIAKDNLIELKNQLKNKKRRVSQLIGLESNIKILPILPGLNLTISDIKITLNKIKNNRTYKIMAENKRNFILAKDIAKRTLLPQVNFFAGYHSMGQDYNLQNRQDTLYGGISSRLNFGRQHEHADHGVRTIDLKKSNLEMKKNLFDLELHILELQNNIEKQKIRIKYSEKKLLLSQKILRAESRNYRIGRKTLNDLIVAKKSLENSRYDLINQQIFYQIIILDWLKTTDQLVQKKNKKILPYLHQTKKK